LKWKDFLNSLPSLNLLNLSYLSSPCFVFQERLALACATYSPWYCNQVLMQVQFQLADHSLFYFSALNTRTTFALCWQSQRSNSSSLSIGSWSTVMITMLRGRWLHTRLCTWVGNKFRLNTQFPIPATGIPQELKHRSKPWRWTYNFKHNYIIIIVFSLELSSKLKYL
jgi:hypothetical protein